MLFVIWWNNAFVFLPKICVKRLIIKQGCFQLANKARKKNAATTRPRIISAFNHQPRGPRHKVLMIQEYPPPLNHQPCFPSTLLLKYPLLLGASMCLLSQKGHLCSVCVLFPLCPRMLSTGSPCHTPLEPTRVILSNKDSVLKSLPDGVHNAP